MKKRAAVKQAAEPNHIRDLTPDPANRRRHNPRNIGMITDALQHVGASRSIVIDEDNVILAGNGVTEAAAEAGITRVRVVEASGDEIIAVRRSGLTPEQKRALAIYDNRTAELAEWNPEQLQADIEAGLSLKPWFSEEELASVLKSAEADRASSEGGARLFPHEDIAVITLRHLRARGFPFPAVARHEAMYRLNRLAEDTDSEGVRSASVQEIADGYHPHRFACPVDGMRTPLDTFADDTALRHAIDMCLEHNKGVSDGSIRSVLVVTHGTQVAANFSPRYARNIYRQYGGVGRRVLDCSAGFGGRLLGAMCAPVAHYVGIDPSTKSIDGNRQMADDFGWSDRVTLLEQPAEDVSVDAIGGPCAMAFTSPPYFAKEQYADEPTQSYQRYPTPSAWRDGFLRPVVQFMADAVESHGFVIVNIDDVHIRKMAAPLIQWTRDAAGAAGLRWIKDEQYVMAGGQGFGRDVPNNSEPVLIFEVP